MSSLKYSVKREDIPHTPPPTPSQNGSWDSSCGLLSPSPNHHTNCARGSARGLKLPRQQLLPPSPKEEAHEPASKRRRLETADDVFGDIEREIGNIQALDDVPFFETGSFRPIAGYEHTFDSNSLHADATCVDRAHDAWGSVLGAPSGDQNLEVQYNFNEEEDSEDIVCFGMIRGLEIGSSQPLDIVSHYFSYCGVAANTSPDGTVTLEDTGCVVGRIKQSMAHILAALEEDQDIKLQPVCTVKHEQLATPKKSTIKQLVRHSLTLSVILYGPLRMFDEVGDYLDKFDIYLQNPQGCNQNVRYRNPQCLNGRDRDAPMTIDNFLYQAELECETIATPVDSFFGLLLQQDLPEAEAPSSLATRLFKHQRQALTFMLRRESECNDQDIWEKRSTASGVPLYTNTITLETQLVAPPQCRGGVLADQMGLGKTLSMISLIASDSDARHKTGGKEVIPALPPDAKQDNGVTLIIVPPALLHVWEGQLSHHLIRGTLRNRRHYLQQKLLNSSELSSYDIILTTYQSLAGEWKKRHDVPSLIFSVKWRRIILDEAHHIRDPKSLTAQAVCSLEADRRWAMTGTPIQNRVTDLAALLRYVRVHPYTDLKFFERDIVQLWREDADEAIHRLRTLISRVVLRRSTLTIELPDRTDQIHHVTFGHAERLRYDEVRSSMLKMLAQATESSEGQSLEYVNVLKGINALRMICNIGLSAPVKLPRSLTSDAAEEERKQWDTRQAQDVFDGLAAAGETLCTECAADLRSLESDCLDLEEGSPSRLSRCSRLICGSCFQKLQIHTESWCGHDDPCEAVAISTASSDIGVEDILPGEIGDAAQMPAKVRSLLRDIQTFRHEKLVVFSSWRSTLNLIATALEAASIGHTRYDGTVSAKDRVIALERFRAEPQITVLLLTISCGADGLDLTAASRAYIMEPQWNPTIEEQALARIHRLGQTKPVTTVRYLMKDSYESHVIEVQKKKNGLVDLLLSSTSRRSINSKVTEFQYLRSLLL